jgi:uncharacterized damage-inducible protein DinB
MAEALVQELDLEAGFTRKLLERVPLEKAAWKPHEKSMPLGNLATFSAVIFTWGVDTMEKDSFDVASVGTEPPQPAKSRDELLAMFDRHVAATRAAIAKATDEHLAKPWTLLAGGQKIFSQPRWLVLRTYVFNHAVHHRGQLTVYLRLLGIPVPAIYNESADEKGGMFIEKQSAPR